MQGGWVGRCDRGSKKKSGLKKCGEQGAGRQMGGVTGMQAYLPYKWLVGHMGWVQGPQLAPGKQEWVRACPGGGACPPSREMPRNARGPVPIVRHA